MTVIKATGTIKFEYNIESLFDDVMRETLMQAAKLSGETDKTDEYGLTEDERPQFNAFLAEAHSKVFAKLLKMTHGITGSIVFDLTGNPNVTPPLDATLSIKIQDKEGYNANYLDVIDKELGLALQNYILKEWYVKCVLADLAKYYESKFIENLKAIQRYGLSLRKPKL